MIFKFTTRMRVRCAPVLLCVWIALGVASGIVLAEPKPAVSGVPERLILNIVPEPDSRMSVTWRSRTSGPQAVQIVALSDLLRPDAGHNTFPAQMESVAIGPDDTVFHYSVVCDDLLPDTWYAYRAGAEPLWSEWNQFRTAAAGNDPFSFLYFGDVQKQIHSFGSQVLRSAFQKEPEAKFWLFAGDMVDNGQDDAQWDEFFSAVGWISRMVPLVPVPGNHEYPNPRITPPEDRRITPLWRPHFTLPENGPPGLEETAYYFTYHGVCFIILNGSERVTDQAEWLEDILTGTDYDWIIVAIHQPVYSISERRNRTEFQQILVPLFDRFQVDLVLQGHDHGYARTHPLKNNQPAGDTGTVYIISNAGAKFYDVSTRYDHLMARTLSRHVGFQAIRVDGKMLHYTAYDMMREPVDSFTLNVP